MKVWIRRLLRPVPIGARSVHENEMYWLHKSLRHSKIEVLHNHSSGFVLRGQSDGESQTRLPFLSSRHLCKDAKSWPPQQVTQAIQTSIRSNCRGAGDKRTKHFLMWSEQSFTIFCVTDRKVRNIRRQSKCKLLQIPEYTVCQCGKNVKRTQDAQKWRFHENPWRRKSSARFKP